MPDRFLHIVSFDVPYPADYGGVIDVYCKIKSLRKAGIKIILHCFQYRRPASGPLDDLCEKVFYYKRTLGIAHLFSSLPYIVCTRSSGKLLTNLMRDNYPILFEGLHSCYLISHPLLKDRRKIVRMHNIEHDYYHGLARAESHILKRAYFRLEARKLKKFESVLHHADVIAAISPADTRHLKNRYAHTFHLAPFHPFEQVEIQAGKGSYALYHGNLSVGENCQAALFLVNEVFNTLETPLIIAGNNPSSALKNAVNKYGHIQIKNISSTEEMYTLISNAQINILPTFQSTGIKLKLITALFKGRHCIANQAMIKETGLEELCTLADNAGQMREKINELFTVLFPEAEIQRRKHLLEKKFSNFITSQKLLAMLETNQ